MAVTGAQASTEVSPRAEALEQTEFKREDLEKKSNDELFGILHQKLQQEKQKLEVAKILVQRVSSDPNIPEENKSSMRQRLAEFLNEFQQQFPDQEVGINTLRITMARHMDTKEESAWTKILSYTEPVVESIRDAFEKVKSGSITAILAVCQKLKSYWDAWFGEGVKTAPSPVGNRPPQTPSGTPPAAPPAGPHQAPEKPVEKPLFVQHLSDLTVMDDPKIEKDGLIKVSFPDEQKKPREILYNFGKGSFQDAEGKEITGHKDFLLSRYLENHQKKFSQIFEQLNVTTPLEKARLIKSLLKHQQEENTHPDAIDFVNNLADLWKPRNLDHQFKDILKVAVDALHESEKGRNNSILKLIRPTKS